MSRRNQRFQKTRRKGLSKAPLRQAMFLSGASRLVLASWLSFLFFPFPDPSLPLRPPPRYTFLFFSVLRTRNSVFSCHSLFYIHFKNEIFVKSPPHTHTHQSFTFSLPSVPINQSRGHEGFTELGGVKLNYKDSERKQMKPEGVAVNYGIKLAQEPSLCPHFCYFYPTSLSEN